MQGRSIRNAFVGAILVGSGLATFPAGGAGAVGPCSAASTRQLAGVQTAAFTSTLAANERVDANAATWTGNIPYPVYFKAGADACWDGGSIKGTFPVTTTWNTFHGNTAFGFGGANFTLNHPRIFNYGDGISVRDGSDNFIISDAYMSYIHDDCIQNDSLVSGFVNNSFLDGCYVGFSARRTDGTSFDGHSNTWAISNSLVRLQAMPTVYKGLAAGHGGFFKWDDNNPVSPKLNITNTIFRADQTTNHGDLVMPAGYDVSCSGNTMVWLGPGAFPGTLPPCFAVTTDRTVWDTAVGNWEMAHPGVVTGPRVSVGDASIVEGTAGARAMAFPLSLSEPPGPGKTVTVYWSTAPGTAGSADFAFKKGKAVFSGSQVFKTLLIAVKPNAIAESNKLMYVVAAGVDGGQNYRERGTGTIVDDDPGSTVRLVVSDATVVEGDSGVRSLVVPIVLTHPAPADVLINWSTVDGTAIAGSDYTRKSGTAKIRANARSVNVTIPLLSDTIAEGTETFSVQVNSAPGVTVLDGTGTVTIRDDD